MPTLLHVGAAALIVIGTAVSGACGGSKPAPRVAAAPSAPPAPAPAPPADTAGLLRVRFARGTTSGIVSDSLLPGETRGYVVGAERGQVMMIHAITWPVRRGPAPPASATVRVYSAEGTQLTTASGEGALWSGRLPSAGDFVVRVSATEPTAYTLAVQIPRPLAVSGADPTAAIRGTAPSRAPVDYLIAGSDGQTLAASVRENDPATLHVYGLDDGVQLAPLSERRRLWAGTLPASQDYVISVVPIDDGARYELTVTLR